MKTQGVHGGAPPTAPADLRASAGATLNQPDEVANAFAVLAALAEETDSLADARAVTDTIIESIGRIEGAVQIDVRHIDRDGRMTTAQIRLGGA